MNLGEICGFDKKKSLLSIKSEIKDVNLGDSISCSGVCLTVSEINKNILNFHLSSETIQKTNLLKYKTGDLINIEKSLKVGDEINGHFVFGHVDGLSQVKKIKKLSDSWVFELKAKNDIMRFLSPKCSISLDGISLTVNNVLKNPIVNIKYHIAILLINIPTHTQFTLLIQLIIKPIPPHLPSSFINHI